MCTLVISRKSLALTHPPASWETLCFYRIVYGPHIIQLLNESGHICRRLGNPPVFHHSRTPDTSPNEHSSMISSGGQMAIDTQSPTVWCRQRTLSKHEGDCWYHLVYRCFDLFTKFIARELPCYKIHIEETVRRRSSTFDKHRSPSP